MKNWGLLAVLIWLNVGQASCFPRRRKSEVISSFHVTGLAIAVGYLIHEYEKEHQKFHEEESSDDGILMWPNLYNKSLSNYCRKYLQHSAPMRSTDSMIGNKIMIILHYKKENTSITNGVIMVHCKIKNSHRTYSYYVTRSPSPKCVYALICTRYKTEFIYNIINKHCNFEDKPFIKHISLKRKREEIVSRINRTTGEPIAKDEYLLQYELEHHEMVTKSEQKCISTEWPQAMSHHNLDSYCSQYMSVCVPRRDRDNVKGNLKVWKLHYRRINITNEEIYVTVLICVPCITMKLRYYMTKAPETNCVYALLWMDGRAHQPMEIIFKHCDFQDPDYWQTSSQYHDIVKQNIPPKTEVKEETLEQLQTKHFFPKD